MKIRVWLSLLMDFTFVAPCPSEETSHESWKLEEVPRLKVVDTTQPGGCRFEGQVAWIGASKKASNLIVATSGEGNTILHFGYRWDVDGKEKPELLKLPYGLPKFLEMPFTAVWSAN